MGKAPARSDCRIELAVRAARRSAAQLMLCAFRTRPSGGGREARRQESGQSLRRDHRNAGVFASLVGTRTSLTAGLHGADFEVSRREVGHAWRDARCRGHIVPADKRPFLLANGETTEHQLDRPENRAVRPAVLLNHSRSFGRGSICSQMTKMLRAATRTTIRTTIRAT